MFLQDFYMFHINLHVLHVSTYFLQDSTSQSDNLFYVVMVQVVTYLSVG